MSCRYFTATVPASQSRTEILGARNMKHIRLRFHLYRQMSKVSWPSCLQSRNVVSNSTSAKILEVVQRHLIDLTLLIDVHKKKVVSALDHDLLVGFLLDGEVYMYTVRLQDADLISVVSQTMRARFHVTPPGGKLRFASSAQ